MEVTVSLLKTFTKFQWARTRQAQLETQLTNRVVALVILTLLPLFNMATNLDRNS